MEQWVSLIDKAAKLSGSQTALAERMGMVRTQISDAKHGRLKLNPERIAKLAEIVGIPAAEVWLAQEDYRNPFRVVETAAVAILAALFLFTLPSESRASARV